MSHNVTAKERFQDPNFGKLKDPACVVKRSVNVKQLLAYFVPNKYPGLGRYDSVISSLFSPSLSFLSLSFSTPPSPGLSVVVRWTWGEIPGCLSLSLLVIHPHPSLCLYYTILSPTLCLPRCSKDSPLFPFFLTFPVVPETLFCFLPSAFFCVPKTPGAIIKRMGIVWTNFHFWCSCIPKLTNLCHELRSTFSLLLWPFLSHPISCLSNYPFLPSSIPCIRSLQERPLNACADHARE